MSGDLYVKGHVLRNYRLEGWNDKIVGRWHYRDLASDPMWRQGWISFDTVTFNPDDDLVYCGLNSIDGDLLYTFNPKDATFSSLHTQRWTDEYDVKIHRTLLYDPVTKFFYFATSLLHDTDQQSKAQGGKLVRYDPQRDSYEVLGVPLSMLYIQSIAADFERGLIYGFTYPAESFFFFDLKSRKSEILAYTGNSLFLSQPHNPIVDNQGWVWGTYAETRAWDETPSQQPVRLFKFHPEGKRFVWFERGLSRMAEKPQLLPDPEKPADASSALAETRHGIDYGFCDSMAFDGERYIYAGTVAGVLCRIDTQTDRVEKIAHVMAAGRFPALRVAEDGTLYGAGGMKGHTQLIRWRFGNNAIDSFFHLWDPELREGPARIHDLAVDRNNKLYLAENDNHFRSSYLWTAELPP